MQKNEKGPPKKSSKNKMLTETQKNEKAPKVFGLHSTSDDGLIEHFGYVQLLMIG